MFEKVLSVYDKKAERYGKPFVSPNLAVAERDFALACKEPKSPMAMFPEDIQLMYIADFDNETGEVKPQAKPILVTEAKNYVKGEDKKNGKGTN